MGMQAVLEAIKKILFSDVIRLEDELKAVTSRQEEILSLLSSMRSELAELRERMARAEEKHGSFKELFQAQLENFSLRMRLLNPPGKRNKRQKLKDQ